LHNTTIYKTLQRKQNNRKNMDSIIVQIPRLQGRKNRLDKVLGIFDQSQQQPDDKHVLCIDESAYANDAEMQRILQRLLAAAANAKMRHDMNVEDEYYSILTLQRDCK